MVVVVVIGVLAMLGVPRVKKLYDRTVSSRVANDFRTFRAAFEHYALEVGYWPDNAGGGIFPEDMEGYLSPRRFEATVEGAVWDWQGPWQGVYGLSLTGTEVDLERMTAVDALLDDGDLSTGEFVLIEPAHYTWVFDEE